MKPIKLEHIENLTCFTCKCTDCKEIYLMMPYVQQLNGPRHFHICGDCMVSFPIMKNEFVYKQHYRNNRICKFVIQIRKDKRLENIIIKN
jgi:hypothetical protein